MVGGRKCSAKVTITVIGLTIKAKINPQIVMADSVTCLHVPKPIKTYFYRYSIGSLLGTPS